MSDDEPRPDFPPGEGAAGEESETRPEESALSPKRFRAAKDEELDPQSYIVSDDRTAAKATLRGGSIGTESGDALFLGEVIQRLAVALRETAAHYHEGVVGLASPLLRTVQFGHSVTLEFQISEVEDIQIGFDGAKHSPTLDAARSLGELLGAEPAVLVQRAVMLGPNVVSAYKGFLNALAKDSVTLELQVADVPEVVVITSDHARRDATILSREGERATVRLIVAGTLSMADSELQQFKLTLPPDVDRHPLLKGKHRVSGSYPLDVGRKLKARNLWDSDVTATIDMTSDLPGTTPIPRGRTYLLVDAEPLIPPLSLFD